MARNVIERIFGVLKHRFRILILSPKYNLQIQAQIPAALCTIHNIIRLHDPQEGPLPDADEPPDEDGVEQLAAVTDDEDDVQDRNEMSGIRNRIAGAMWEQYQQVVRERELAGVEDLDIEDLLLEFDENEGTDEDADTNFDV